MTNKKNPKWVSLMDALAWNQVSVWGNVTDKYFAKHQPVCREWVIKQRPFIASEALQAFDKFFISETSMESYDYALKERAVTALLALYRKECENA